MTNADRSYKARVVAGLLAIFVLMLAVIGITAYNSKIQYDINRMNNQIAETQKEIQNLQAEGKVVKIDGDFEMLGSNWSIMEANGEGQSIGTTVKLLSGDYPEGDCRAVVTGVVVNDGLSAYITTTADNITIVE